MLSIGKFLPSRRKLIALLCGLLAVFLVWWWRSSRVKSHPTREPFSPAGELDRIMYAVDNARAWHVTTIGTLRGEPFQTDQDVVCPFDSHIVTRSSNTAGATTMVQELI